MLKVNNLSGFSAGGVEAPVVYTQLYLKLWAGNFNRAGQTIVLVTPQSIAGYTKFRIRALNGTDTSATIDAVYFGELSGTYSFGAAPALVTWGDPASTSLAFTTANTPVTSNMISYTPSVSGNKLCIAYNVNANNSYIYNRDNNGSGWAVYTKSGADASTQSKSGYSAAGTQRTALIEMVEAAP